MQEYICLTFEPVRIDHTHYAIFTSGGDPTLLLPLDPLHLISENAVFASHIATSNTLRMLMPRKRPITPPTLPTLK